MRTRRFSSSPAARPSRQKVTNEASSPPQLLAMSHIFCWTQGALKTTEGKAEVPSLDKEGWLRPLRKCREASVAGADGVVGSSHRLSEVEPTTLPCFALSGSHSLRSCPAAPPKERDHLLDGAATPPLPRRGVWLSRRWGRARLCLLSGVLGFLVFPTYVIPAHAQAPAATPQAHVAAARAVAYRP